MTCVVPEPDWRWVSMCVRSILSVLVALSLSLSLSLALAVAVSLALSAPHLSVALPCVLVCVCLHLVSMSLSLPISQVVALSVMGGPTSESHATTGMIGYLPSYPRPTPPPVLT
eukprot:2508218-Rhodomonas_salina.2